MNTYLQVENASKAFGETPLFTNINFTVEEGQKVALIARNGAGKTTLMNILAGKDTFDTGTFYRNRDITIGYLDQNPQFNPDLTLFQTVYGAAGKLMETVRQYEMALHLHQEKKLEEATALMDFYQAWDLDARIKQTLGVLKLTHEDQLVGALSGGQVKRLALAVTLINQPHLLMLDEPTNHLDLEMIEWLEELLIKSPITLLLVTHDRYFLDRVCDEIIEIDERTAYSYRGNYSAFLRKREERLQNKAQMTEKAQNLLRTELEWMRRMPKARTTKAKYRIDAFYTLQQQSNYRRNDRSMEISVQTSRLGKKILTLEDVSKKFGEVVILDQFSYTFSRGEKLGIIGSNGTGKTTFLNIVTGQLQPDSGRVEQGETVVYGYYRQQGLEFEPGKRVIDIMKDIAEVVTLGDGRQVPVSQFLNLFLFTPDMHHVQVEKLSGGEKRRLYLMTVLIRNPNFLVLDEPTNDFDVVTLNVLETYLAKFGGCLIMVSHDRFFMDKLVDHLFIFEGSGVVYDFPGNYSEYRASQKYQETEASLSDFQSRAASSAKPVKGSAASVRKGPSYGEKREFEVLSGEIELLEKEKTALESSLSGGNMNSQELIGASIRVGELIDLIDRKTDRWLELSERLFPPKP